MKVDLNIFSLLVAAMLLLSACSSDSEPDNSYQPTPYQLELPQLFDELLPPLAIPADNPLTEEGVSLGKRLFFDRRLSADNTLSCAGCHRPPNAFSDPRALSVGINGEQGIRNSMPLQNLAFNSRGLFNWDGSASSLEDQIFEPVTNPLEMDNTWPNVLAALQTDAQYPGLFEQAFGSNSIDSTMVSRALAQFIRIMISGNSKFDRYLLGEVELSAQELNGLDVFMNEERGDCFHCHGNPNNPLWTDNRFHNNGLDESFPDLGRGGVTGDPREFGTFRSPSLRNLAYTAPYMHDGRFATLDEVIDHYSEGLVYSPTIDPLMKSVAEGGVQLSQEDKAALKAFLLTLSDPSFINNPDFQNQIP